MFCPLGKISIYPASINLDKDKNYIIKGETVRYSYTGGIIGLVNEGVVLDSCYNSGDINLLGDATYKGALAEINEGRFSTVKRRALGIIRLYILEELQDAMQKQGKYIIVQLLE